MPNEAANVMGQSRLTPVARTASPSPVIPRRGHTVILGRDLEPRVARLVLPRRGHTVILGRDPIRAKITAHRAWHRRFTVMAGPDPAICTNTMARAMERQAEAMTNKGPCRRGGDVRVTRHPIRPFA